MPLSDLATLLNPPGVRQAGSAGLVTVTPATTTLRLHQVGTGRRCRIKKISWANRGAAGGFLNIGDTADGTTAGAWTQRLAGIPITAGQGDIIDEDRIPAYEFNPTNNILAQISASTNVDVVIEVSEF